VVLLLRALPSVADRAVAILLRAELGTALTLLSLPVAIAGFGYTVVKEILHLGDPKRQKLVSWPGYWRLKMRCSIGMAWTGIGVAGSWGGILALHLLHGRVGLTIIACAATVSVVSLVSLIRARFDASDILDKNGGA